MANLTSENIATPPDRLRSSAATLVEHSDARWADLQRRGTDRDETRQRRLWIIASIIGSGLMAWLLLTVR